MVSIDDWQIRFECRLLHLIAPLLASSHAAGSSWNLLLSENRPRCCSAWDVPQRPQCRRNGALLKSIPRRRNRYSHAHNMLAYHVIGLRWSGQLHMHLWLPIGPVFRLILPDER